MARNDDEFCRLETSFVLDDARFFGLKGNYLKVYFWLWAMAVRVRKETLSNRFDSLFIANRCGLSRNTCKNAIKKLLEMNLISQCEDGRLTVNGVRDKHKRLNGWNDRYGDDRGQTDAPLRVGYGSESERESERENNKGKKIREEILELAQTKFGMQNFSRPNGTSKLDDLAEHDIRHVRIAIERYGDKSIDYVIKVLQDGATKNYSNLSEKKTTSTDEPYYRSAHEVLAEINAELPEGYKIG